MDLIAVVNESNQVKADEALKIAQAIGYQITHHAAPDCNLRDVPVRYYASIHQVPAEAWVLAILEDPDVADALGYHDLTPNGLPYMDVFTAPTLAVPGAGVLHGSETVSSVCSHEALEAIGDRWANAWAQAPDGALFAWELCDPVESDGYIIQVAGQPVVVSNYVLPKYFDPSAPKGSKFDRMGKLTQPFSLDPGGYLIVQQGGEVTQKFGESFPEHKRALKEWKLRARHGRIGRRMEAHRNDDFVIDRSGLTPEVTTKIVELTAELEAEKAKTAEVLEANQKLTDENVELREAMLQNAETMQKAIDEEMSKAAEGPMATLAEELKEAQDAAIAKQIDQAKADKDTEIINQATAGHPAVADTEPSPKA